MIKTQIHDIVLELEVAVAEGEERGGTIVRRSALLHWPSHLRSA